MLKSYLHSEDSFNLKILLITVLVNFALIFISTSTKFLGVPFLIIAAANNIRMLIPEFARSWVVHALNNGFATVCDTYISDKMDVTKVDCLLYSELHPRRYYIIGICDKIAIIYFGVMLILSTIIFIINLLHIFK